MIDIVASRMLVTLRRAGGKHVSNRVCLRSGRRLPQSYIPSSALSSVVQSLHLGPPREPIPGQRHQNPSRRGPQDSKTARSLEDCPMIHADSWVVSSAMNCRSARSGAARRGRREGI
jgi:hypothetical protein